MIEQRSSNVFTQALYLLSTTWMGISLYILWALIIVFVMRLFINIPLKEAGIMVLVAVSILSVYSVFNAYHIHEKSVQIPLANLKTHLKLVQLSDVHIGSIRNSGFIKRIVGRIKDINPDAVLITGDMADGSAPITEHTFLPLKELEMPIFFVSGNHDTYAGLENVSNALQSAGVHILDNDFVEFRGVQLVGICYCMQRNMLGPLLKQINFDKKKPSILMHHLPSEWDKAREEGINLQLSGHTHNGQFYPFNLLVKIMFPYLGGLYKKDDDYIYVSSGTGTWGPPMRLGSHNEITIINLVRDES
ncbi:metallophosphoesterase [Methanobacterium alcaliphilum]|uniref:metallophosphoesterase n=1 Tax=Methanobacterium alcaliphilum TaxID=392018 RepID=UPI00200AA2CD